LNGKRRVAHTVQGLKQGHTLMKKRAGTVKKTMSGLLNSAEPQANSTKAGTIAKGASRQAHVPNQVRLMIYFMLAMVSNLFNIQN